MAAPLRRYANTIGADASKLSVRGTLHKGAAKSASASSSNPAVWFAFSGQPFLQKLCSAHVACTHAVHMSCTLLHSCLLCLSYVGNIIE